MESAVKPKSVKPTGEPVLEPIITFEMISSNPLNSISPKPQQPLAPPGVAIVRVLASKSKVKPPKNAGKFNSRPNRGAAGWEKYTKPGGWRWCRRSRLPAQARL